MVHGRGGRNRNSDLDNRVNRLILACMLIFFRIVKILLRLIRFCVDSIIPTMKFLAWIIRNTEILHAIIDLVCLGVPNYISWHALIWQTASKLCLCSIYFWGSIYDMMELAYPHIITSNADEASFKLQPLDDEVIFLEFANRNILDSLTYAWCSICSTALK